MSSFSAQGILDICPKDLAGRLDITLFDELDSTNTYLKKLARAGALGAAFIPMPRGFT